MGHALRGSNAAKHVEFGFGFSTSTLLGVGGNFSRATNLLCNGPSVQRLSQLQLQIKLQLQLQLLIYIQK